MKILIVDDSRTGRSYIVKTLLIVGLSEIDILQANNGLDALKILSNVKIDVLFLDINMPQMDGLEVLATLKKDNLLDKMSIIITSSVGDETKKTINNLYGIYNFLRKPFTPESLNLMFEKVQQNG